MAGSSRRTAKTAVLKDWRARALQMHIDGFPMREIAAKVGKAVSTVHEGITAELAEITRPAAEKLQAIKDEQRAIAAARLEVVVRGSLGAARRGDPEAAHVIIAAVRQHAKLFGLDAPARTEVSGPSQGPIHFDLSALTDDQIARLTRGDLSALGGPEGDAGAGPVAPEPGEGGAGAPPPREGVEG